jgi:hypothetical protein
MNILLEPLLAELEAKIRAGLLVNGPNLGSDLRGIVLANEVNSDSSADMLVRIEAGLTAAISCSSAIGATPEQLRPFNVLGDLLLEESNRLSAARRMMGKTPDHPFGKIESVQP